MKANELMIGDWVCVNGLTQQVFDLAYNQNEKELTIGVLDPQGDVYQCFYGFDHVEPIPLTAEILEKNGFVYISKGMLYSYYNYAADGYIKIILSDLLDGEWELSIENYDKFNDSSIKYTVDRCFLKVHELQHALKLCGIEKDIQL